MFKIKVDLAKQPTDGKPWNVKGSDAAKMLKNFGHLVQRLGVADAHEDIIKQVKKCFKVMFLFEFETEQAKGDQIW